MEHDDDVGRLFSWLKTPDLRYREFANEREISDAAATWPGLRRATESVSPEEGEAPVGVEAQPEEAVSPNPLREPLGDRLRAALGGHPPASRSGLTFRDVVTPPEPGRDHAPESVGSAIHYENPDLESPEEPHPAPEQRPSGARAGLFGGSYRGFGDDEAAAAPAPPAPAAPSANPEGRALDAVFSRLARPAGHYRDERKVPGVAGRGPMFRRLR